MFGCEHKWEVLSETITKSKFESSLEAAEAVVGGDLNLPPQLVCAERKHIQVFTCSRCGSLKDLWKSYKLKVLETYYKGNK